MINVSLFVGEFAATGWLAYPPLSGVDYSPWVGVDYWLHWFPGDSPDGLHRFLRQTGVTSRQNPQSNGLIQGALGLFLDQGA